ncbi:SRPBCC family protein [Salininema proteolyticum]|uniref:SRPBCC family protein n=1 Tax=Salininema proteolyticum TaxID=1607685 RepID=A0ABV8TZK3_9ACTN
MKVRTSHPIPKPIEAVWPLLCDSRTTLPHRSLLFRLGLPRPVECRLPDGEGGVGQQRECVSADGSVTQEITAWEPPYRLEFRMVRTNLIHRLFTDEVVERFELESIAAGSTQVTRTTTVKLKKPFFLACPFVKLGVRTVHRFVITNWAAA